MASEKFKNWIYKYKAFSCKFAQKHSFRAKSHFKILFVWLVWNKEISLWSRVRFECLLWVQHLRKYMSFEYDKSLTWLCESDVLCIDWWAYRIGKLVVVVVQTLQTSSQNPLGHPKPNYAPPLTKGEWGGGVRILLLLRIPSASAYLLVCILSSEPMGGFWPNSHIHTIGTGQRND